MRTKTSVVGEGSAPAIPFDKEDYGHHQPKGPCRGLDLDVARPQQGEGAMTSSASNMRAPSTLDGALESALEMGARDRLDCLQNPHSPCVLTSLPAVSAEALTVLDTWSR